MTTYNSETPLTPALLVGAIAIELINGADKEKLNLYLDALKKFEEDEERRVFWETVEQPPPPAQHASLPPR